MNSGVPEGLAAAAPLVTPVVFLLNDTNLIRGEIVLDISMCK